MNFNKKTSKNGFLVLLIDVLFVIAILIFVFLELAKNPQILASFVRALRGGY